MLSEQALGRGQDLLPVADGVGPEGDLVLDDGQLLHRCVERNGHGSQV